MIRSLTSMRFFAALLVFVYHYQWLNIDYSLLPLGQLWSNLVSHGYLGVSFFFVLSGFVMNWADQQKFLGEGIGLAHFIRFTSFLLVVLGLSALSHRYIELPMNAWVKRTFVRFTNASG